MHEYKPRRPANRKVIIKNFKVGSSRVPMLLAFKIPVHYIEIRPLYCSILIPKAAPNHDANILPHFIEDQLNRSLT